MKYLFLPLFFLFGLCLSADAQLTRTINTTFKADEITSVIGNFEQEVEHEEWTGSRILVETNISLEYASVPIIEALIEAGRYELESNSSGGLLEISAKPDLKKEIIIKGVYVEEVVKYRIFVPEGLPIEIIKTEVMADPYYPEDDQ
ncbi:MAG: hypothetical protein AAF598_04025 [Bacteroidota bacterium]